MDSAIQGFIELARNNGLIGHTMTFLHPISQSGVIKWTVVTDDYQLVVRVQWGTGATEHIFADVDTNKVVPHEESVDLISAHEGKVRARFTPPS